MESESPVTDNAKGIRLPTGWTTGTVETFAQITTGDKDTKDRVADGLYPFIVRSQTVEQINTFSYDGEAVLTAGDGVGTGKVFHYLKGKFDFHQRVYCIRRFSPHVFGKFFFYYFSRYFIERVRRYSAKNSVDSVRRAMIADMPIALPPLCEQRKIAAILSTVDEVIQKTEAVIDGLQALKNAMTQELLSRGLPGQHGSFKQTEIGEIPDDWTVCSLGDLCESVSDGPHFSPKYVTADTGIPFLSARNLTPDEWKLDDIKYVSREDHAAFCRRAMPKLGDVLYTKGGTTGVARVNDLPFDFSIWVHIALLKMNGKVNPHFLVCALNSPLCYRQARMYTHGTSNQDLGLRRMVKIRLPLPSLDEQQQIADRLGAQSARLTAERGVMDFLKQLKEALISVLLTGELRVAPDEGVA